MSYVRNVLCVIASLAAVGPAPLIACSKSQGANANGSDGQNQPGSTNGSSAGAPDSNSSGPATGSGTGGGPSSSGSGSSSSGGSSSGAADAAGAGDAASSADATIPIPTVIPYPSALTASAVTETSLTNFSNNALVIGNGEVTGTVYTQGNDLYIQVGKNDFFDSRADTSNDPDMPTVNAAAGTFTSGCGQDCNPPSWNNYVYPSSVSVGIIKLAGAAGQNGWTSHSLDLTHAVVTSKSSADTTSSRVLYQSNVLYFDTSRTVTMSAAPNNCALQSEPGCGTDALVGQMSTMNGYTVVSQMIPSDPDVPSETAYMVLGTSGSRAAVAVVSSRESMNPLSDAVTLVQNTLSQADSALLQAHEAGWQQFWAASGVQLDDATLQRWWYHMVYFNRVWAKANGNAVGLKGVPDSPPGWHDALTLDYNAQEAYSPGAPENHSEFIEPYINTLTYNLPRAEWFAQTAWNAEGAKFHMDFWPFEPNPASCTTKNKHQITYMPWGYVWGSDGASSVLLWEYYKYNPDTAHLNRIWPLLKDFALFTCSILEQCKTQNGAWHIGPGFFPENGPYGTYNNPYDIANLTFELQAAEEAATLEGDMTTASRISADLAKMPPYPTATDPSQGNATIMAMWEGSGPQSNDGCNNITDSLYPTGLVNFFSSQDDQDLIARTINYMESTSRHANVVNPNIQRARLVPNSTLKADPISNAKQYIGGTELPNGLFTMEGDGLYFWSEQVGLSRLVTELLLQSVGDVIRVFPAWPASEGNAHFSTLAAQGGFLVSADFVSGAVTGVKILSTHGGSVNILNPWSAAIKAVDDTGQTITVTTSATVANVNTFATSVGRTYTLTHM